METKLTKSDVTSSGTTRTNYCGNVIYENGTPTQLLTDNGYITLSDNKYHFYYKDHEGNNRVVVDQSNTVEQVNNYYPFGLSYKNDASTSANKYKYNGKELQPQHGLDWYDYGARFYDPELCQWHAIDPSCEKYYDVSPYAYCAGNPIKLIDSNGKDVWLFATRLPTTTSGDEKSWIPLATHTFIVVIGKDCIPHYYAYGGDNGMSGRLSKQEYQQDIKVYTEQERGVINPNLKSAIKIPVPKGITSQEFDKRVQATAESFGNNPGIQYKITGTGETYGNCNTSTSTILFESGVTKEMLSKIKSEIPGILWGFGNIKPWTEQEQKIAVQGLQETIDDFRNRHQYDFGNVK